MGLLSILKRTGDAPAAGPAEAGDAVQQARVRARRRLIGATVLLVIGVIGFPLVFETRPRPIPVDIPIEIPRKEGAPPLAMPPPRAAAPTAVPPVPQQSGANEAGVITESRSEAGREVAPRGAGAAERAASPAGSAVAEAGRRAAAATASSVEPARRAGAAPAATRTETPKATGASDKATQTAASAKPSTPESAKPLAAADASRARALLEAKPAAAEGGRYVVQVGAFAEAESARETRQKVEKLGLKTYTQVAQTPSGSRIRVRIGPFGTRAEADAALAKARAAGLKPVVLTL
jgi:DedD protein